MCGKYGTRKGEKMTWIPSNLKIVNFGQAWLNNMLIPETTDPVLGEDDPGVVPIAIGSMGSASAQCFAYQANNLQHLHDIMVIDNVSITVTNVTELQAALNILDRVIYVHKDKTFGITLTAGTYAWPDSATEPRAALQCYGVHGAGSVVFTAGPGVTIEGDCETVRPLVEFIDCTCNLVISGALVLSNTKTGGTRAVTFDNVRQVTALDLEIRNKVSGDTLSSGVYCREADFIDLGLTITALVGLSTGVGRAVYARQNSQVYFDSGNLDIGKLDNEAFYLEKNSQILFEDFASCLPLGANTGFYHDDPVTIDQSSKIEFHDGSSSGSGTSSSPFLITVAWESATDTPKLIQYILHMLPRPLNVWVKLKLPAGTMTEPLEILDLDGRGGLMLEGNTVLISPGTTQDTIIDNDDNGIDIKRCQIPVLITSIAIDNDQGQACVLVSGCRDVRLFYMYWLAPTGTGGSQYYGNGLFVNTQSRVLVGDTIAGTCNQNACYADYGSEIKTYDCDIEGPLSRPAQFGNFARNGGIITRSDWAGEYFYGAGGTDSEDKGGKVFNS